MEITMKVRGLNEAANAIRKAFPSDPEQQRRILTQAMSAAAKPSIVAEAKELAKVGDSSGALSESIKTRTVSSRQSLPSGVPARVQVVPVRKDRKALAMYIDYYYNRLGYAAPISLVTYGLRYGHLIEFGSKRHGAQPFLYPAAQSQFGRYRLLFAKQVRKKIEAAVRRAARKTKPRASSGKTRDTSFKVTLTEFGE